MAWARSAVVGCGLAVLTACASGDGRALPEVEVAVTTTVLQPDVSASLPGATVSAPVAGDGGSTAVSAPVAGDGESADVSESSGADVTPDGFERTSATITSPDGDVCDLCLWVADSADRRRRGLMEVTDLGEADGMIFRYGAEHSTQFWMKNTPMPLSIAFFGADGTFLDAFDMPPCTTEVCPRYDSPRGLLDAIEFPMGTLDDFLVGPGSTLDVSGLPCA